MNKIFKYIREQRAHQRTIALTVTATLAILKLLMLTKLPIFFILVPLAIYVIAPRIEGLVAKIKSEFKL